MSASPRPALIAAVLCACLGAAAAGADAPAADLAVFERASARLVRAWEDLQQRVAKELAAVEGARSAARRLERAAASPADAERWRSLWMGVKATRAAVHLQHEEHMAAWTQALRPLVTKDRKQPHPAALRQRIAARCLAVLRRRLLGGEPGAVLAALTTTHTAWATALGWLRDDAARRELVATVADRLAGTPGSSDLDVLCDTVRWEALFLKGLGAGKPQLQALSADLVLVFTERATNGVSLSKSQLYRRRHLSGRGLRAELRDGSDQVRHFAWAFRMFARSANYDATERLLALKERADATSRKQPLNQADLALNRSARRLVEQILDVAADEPAPVPVERYAQRVRLALGPGAR